VSTPAERQLGTPGTAGDYRPADAAGIRRRVRLQNYPPVARFGASFYITTRERFTLDESGGSTHSTAIDEI
jgi:hypothetical protein